MKKLFAVLIVTGAFICNAAKAQTSGAQPDTATLNFVTQATIGSMKEIKTGKLATQKAQDASVKAFGARMITDHTKASKDLMKIVKSKGYQMPPPASAEVTVDPMLKSASGAAFDKSYVSMMVMDHQKTVDLFQRQATNGTVPEIKAFAQQQLPILQEHLTSIKSIASKMNIGTM